MTPPVDTAKLRELLAKATPGPWATWTWEHVDGKHHRITYKARGLNKGANFTVAEMEGTEGNNTNESKQDAVNAALIVAAVNALPALLDELDAARAVVAIADARRPGFGIHTHINTGACAGCKRCEEIDRKYIAALDAYDRARGGQ